MLESFQALQKLGDLANSPPASYNVEKNALLEERVCCSSYSHSSCRSCTPMDNRSARTSHPQTGEGMTDSARSPFVELRAFGPEMPPRVGDISDLHERMLPTSPIVLLGRPFVERFYYSVLPRAGAIFGFVAYV